MGFVNELAESLYGVASLDRNQPIYEWAKNLTLRGTIEGLQGSKVPNFDDFPDIKQIFDESLNPDCKEIILDFSAQTGKTFPELILMLHHASVRGHVTMVALPSIDKRDKVRERLKSLLQANKEFLGWDDSRGATKGLSFKFFNGAYIHWGLLTSPDTLAETPADVIFADEIDEFFEKRNVKISPIEQFKNRIQSKPHGKMYLSCTPKVGEGGGGILDEYNASQRHICEMKCPKCGGWSEFKIDDIKCRDFDENDFGQIKVNRLGYAICPQCSEELDDSDHYKMSRNCRFTPIEADKGKTGIRKGFHKAVWNSLIKNWSFVAYDHETAKSRGAMELADFYNSKCADPQEIDSGETASELNKGEYLKGQVPEDVGALTMGIDVGREFIHIVVMGHAPNNVKYVIDWEVYNYGSRANFKEVGKKVDEYLFHKFYKTLGGQNLNVRFGAIDAGFSTPDVYSLCVAQHRLGKLIPIFGREKVKQKWMGSSLDPKNEYNYRNSTVQKYSLNHNYFQDKLESYLMSEPENGGAVVFPKDLWTNFEEHLSNMRVVMEGKKATWKQLTQYRRVDFRDCTIYNIAISEINDLIINKKSTEKTQKRKIDLSSLVK